MQVRNTNSENYRVVPFQRYLAMFSPRGVQPKRKITAFSDLAHGLNVCIPSIYRCITVNAVIFARLNFRVERLKNKLTGS